MRLGNPDIHPLIIQTKMDRRSRPGAAAYFFDRLPLHSQSGHPTIQYRAKPFL